MYLRAEMRDAVLPMREVERTQAGVSKKEETPSVPTPQPCPRPFLTHWKSHSGGCSLGSVGSWARPPPPGEATLQDRPEALSVSDLIKYLL